MPPKISVILSVCNGLPYLEEAVESILNQTFTDFEFIIIDDCSSDRSWEVLNHYAEQDERIKLFKNDHNIGLTRSLNKGLELAQGAYIARQDADDVSLPGRFKSQVSVLEKEPEVVLVSCDLEVIDSEGYKIKEDRRACPSNLIPWYLLFYNYVGGHSQVMFRYRPIQELGGYSESCQYSQDYELWSRLINVGKFSIIPEILHKQRYHNQRISIEKVSEQQTLSLKQSRHNITQLIDAALSLEEVALLRAFWRKGYSKGKHPSNRRIRSIHRLNQKLYLAFLQRHADQKVSERELAQQLRVLIGNQFIYWVNALCKTKHLPYKFILSIYAFFWNPTGLVQFWLSRSYAGPIHWLTVLKQLYRSTGSVNRWAKQSHD